MCRTREDCPTDQLTAHKEDEQTGPAHPSDRVDQPANQLANHPTERLASQQIN